MATTKRKSTKAKTSKTRKKTIPKQAIAAARKKRPNQYPLPLAEKRLRGLYAYVKKAGGKLPA
jgi:hypothetical protein